MFPNLPVKVWTLGDDVAHEEGLHLGLFAIAQGNGIIRGHMSPVIAAPRIITLAYLRPGPDIHLEPLWSWRGLQATHPEQPVTDPHGILPGFAVPHQVAGIGQDNDRIMEDGLGFRDAGIAVGATP